MVEYVNQIQQINRQEICQNNYSKSEFNQNPCQTSEMDLFRKLLLALEPNPVSCQTSKMEPFAKRIKNEKLFIIFSNDCHLECFTKS